MKIKNLISAGVFILVIISIISVISVFTGCSKMNPKIQFELENGDIFIVELYPKYAPKTVDNFVKLTEEGFFDGLTFHRIVDGFMAQGGGYDTQGQKKPAQTVKGEFESNGYKKNTLKHTKGVISMARSDTSQSGDPIPGYNSASSEFFIMLGSAPYLDGDYAAFGKVIEGMKAVEKLQKVERTIGFDGAISSPVEPVVIKKVTVIS